MATQTRPQKMTEDVLSWVRKVAPSLFALEDFRGSIVINFDTTTGVARPQAHLSADWQHIAASSPPKPN